jgi:hypothetical protein
MCAWFGKPIKSAAWFLLFCSSACEFFFYLLATVTGVAICNFMHQYHPSCCQVKRLQAASLFSFLAEAFNRLSQFG